MTFFLSVLAILLVGFAGLRPPVVGHVAMIWVFAGIFWLGWAVLVWPNLAAERRDWIRGGTYTLAERQFGYPVGPWLAGPFTLILLVGIPASAGLLTWRWLSGGTRQTPLAAGASVAPEVTSVFPDEFVAEHFGHHPAFAQRVPGGRWRFNVVDVPVNSLHCLYPDPGVTDANPAGLMGAVGLAPVGHGGVPIVDLARSIREAIIEGKADLSNPALAKLIRFREAGPAFILSRDEPIALSQVGGRWCVREGTHRVIALALLGVATLKALHFESAYLET